MGRFDAEIDKYFGNDAASRAIAQAFADHFENHPFSARAIPAMLQESAAINAKILAGEMSSIQGRELLFSTAVEGYGLPPQIVSAGQAWFDEIAAQQADGEPAAPEPRGAEPPGPHSDLIRRLFAPEERAAVRSLVSVMSREPQLQSRIAPLLHEISKSTDLGPQASYDLIADWMKSTGWPSYLIDSTLDAISAPAVAAHDAAVLHELVGDLSPRAQNAQRVAEREAAQKDIVRIQALMNAPPGSAEWKQYWHGEAGAKTQQEYRAALEASLVEPPAALPVEAPAPAPAAPVPAPAVEQPAV
jgi:hypothetical protein